VLNVEDAIKTLDQVWIEEAQPATDGQPILRAAFVCVCGVVCVNTYPNAHAHLRHCLGFMRAQRDG